jgi:hypothetical protein
MRDHPSHEPIHGSILTLILVLFASGATWAQEPSERQVPDYPNWGPTPQTQPDQPFGAFGPLGARRAMNKELMFPHLVDRDALAAVLPPGYTPAGFALGGAPLPSDKALVYFALFPGVRVEYLDDQTGAFPGETFGPFLQVNVFTFVYPDPNGNFEVFLLATYFGLGSAADENLEVFGTAPTKARIDMDIAESDSALASPGRRDMSLSVRVFDARGLVFGLAGTLENLGTPTRFVTGPVLFGGVAPDGSVKHFLNDIQGDETDDVTAATVLTLPAGVLRLPNGASLPVDRNQPGPGLPTVIVREEQIMKMMPTP